MWWLGWLGLVYIVGALLEIAGISLVALDVRDSSRPLRDYLPQSYLPNYIGTSNVVWAVRVEYDSAPATTPDQRLDRLESNLKALFDHHNTAADMLIEARGHLHEARPMIDRAVAGNLRRRRLGVVLFLAGVIVQTAGNIAAL